MYVSHNVLYTYTNMIMILYLHLYVVVDKPQICIIIVVYDNTFDRINDILDWITT